MEGISVLLILLFYTAVNQGVEGVRLDVTPSQNLQSGATSLTLRCSPTVSSGYAILLSIQINKQITLVVVDLLGTRPGTGIIGPKYTVTGNFQTKRPAQSYLQVVIKDPDCNDAAEYQCITNGIAGTSQISFQEDKNVTFQSGINMMIYPNKQQYDVGENIEITCHVNVGNPQWSWSWESISPGDSYPTPIRENITDGQVDPPASSACGYYSRSKFSYYVGKNDTGLEIRCMVGNSAIYSAKKIIYIRSK